MAVRLADAIVALAADVDSLKADLNKAQGVTAGATGDMSKRTRTMGEVMKGVFQGVGQGLVGLAADALRGTMTYLKDSIAAASDLGETTSKIGVLFGDSAGDIMTWSQNAATSLGQSQQSALDAAATFATFGKAAGLTGQDLTKFSTDFVALASDLASFNNTTPEQAIEAIGAALRGESEPLRAYGVLLDDATLRQKALELGLISTTKQALTPQQKVLAAQAAIYEQTAAAQGDFARTSGGLANQQRILSAQMTNLKATIGTALLPVALSMATIFNELAQKVLPPVAAFLQITLVPAIRTAAEALYNFISAIIDAGVNSSEAREALGLFPDALQPLVMFVARAIAALGSLAGSIGSLVGGAIRWFGTLRSTVATDGTGALSLFKSWIDENLPRIQAIVQRVLGAIQTFWAAHGAQIMAVVTRYMAVVVQVIDTAIRTAMDVVTLILQLLNGEWTAAGATLTGIVRRIWATIQAIFNFYLTTLRGVITGIDWLALGSLIMNGVRDGILAGAIWVYGAMVGTFQLVTANAMLVLSGFRGNVDQWLAGLKTAWAAAWASVFLAYQAVENLLAAGWTMLQTWMITTLPNAFTKLKEDAASKWEEIKNSVTSKIGLMTSSLTSLKTWLETTIQAAFTSLKTFLGSFTISNPFAGMMGWLDSIKSNIQWIIDSLPLIGGSGGGGGGKSKGGRSVAGSRAVANSQVLLEKNGGVSLTREGGAAANVAIAVHVHVQKIDNSIDEYAMAYRVADVVRRALR